MNYLSPSEYEAYALEPTLPAAWVAAASALMDAYCRRATLSVAQYSERLRLTAGRNTVRLTYLPLATVAPATTPIVSARARYALPRRGEGGSFTVPPFTSVFDLAYDVSHVFALPGSWTALSADAIDSSAETGELTFPINVLGLPFNEVEIGYTAGLSVIPDAAKFACAQIIRNAQATPALNVRAGTIDRMHLEYFTPTLFDDTVQRLLAQYVAQKVVA